MEDCRMPERLDRTVIYESDYVCLYADKVRFPGGYIVEKYTRSIIRRRLSALPSSMKRTRCC